jgi:hypothetical protein
MATETENIVVNDSVAVIKNSVGTTLKSENILAQASENITINDSSVENSDASYSVDVLAQGSLTLPDSQINVNSVDSGDVVSVKTIDVNLEDSLGAPVVPTSVGLVGNTLTIEVPSGGGSYDIDTTDRFGNVLPTINVSSNTTLDWQSYNFAQDYINALSTPPSSTLENAIIDLVDDLIGFGLWDKMRAIWLLNMGTAIDTALNLKYPFATPIAFNLLHVGSPTYNTDGIQYNTTTNHSYTRFNPEMLGNGNYHFGIYSQTNSLPTGPAIDMGFDGQFTGIFARDNNTNRSGYQLNATTNVTGSNTNSEGHYIANALGTSGKLVKNGGTTLASGTIANNNTYLGFTINGRTASSAGGSVNRTGRKYSFAHVGEALTDTEIADLYTAIQTYHTTLGIQK